MAADPLPSNRHLSYAGRLARFGYAGQWWASIPPAQWPDHHRESIEKEWDPAFGDRRQELVLIGQRLDRDAFVAALDACLLTDAELTDGPDGWAGYPDLFPGGNHPA